VSLWRRLRSALGGRGRGASEGGPAPEEDAGSPAAAPPGEDAPRASADAVSAGASRGSPPHGADPGAPSAEARPRPARDPLSALVLAAGLASPRAGSGFPGAALESPPADAPPPADEDLAAAVVTLTRAGREAEALRLGRAALGQRPDSLALAHALAVLASSRGDDAAASAFLAPVLGAAVAPGDLRARALLLAAEIAERRGDAAEALAHYERILASDLDFPGARERAARLRGAAARGTASGAAGATLLADAALSRGRYRVLRELGRGGAGTVFEARDVRTERLVALKLYHGRSPADRERLRAEARVPAGLDHPGVIRVLDVDEALVALAIERVPGGAIRDALRAGAVPVARARRWLRSIAEALAFLHASGFVHRDLKPSNCLLRADDRVVLTDFGVARRIGEAPPPESAGEGTLGYMPAEQRAGGPAAPSADVHALGVTAREIAAASVGDAADVKALAALAAWCAAANPADRPSVAQILEALGPA
jgi:serine/threonine-protein kinase